MGGSTPPLPLPLPRVSGLASVQWGQDLSNHTQRAQRARTHAAMRGPRALLALSCETLDSRGSPSCHFIFSTHPPPKVLISCHFNTEEAEVQSSWVAWRLLHGRWSQGGPGTPESSGACGSQRPDFLPLSEVQVSPLPHPASDWCERNKGVPGCEGQPPDNQQGPEGQRCQRQRSLTPSLP